MDQGIRESAVLQPRGCRHAVTFDATVIRGDHRLGSRISDLSLDGCCLSGYFTVGEFVRLHIRGLGHFAAQIRWVKLGRAGVRFVSETPQNAVSANQGTIDSAP